MRQSLRLSIYTLRTTEFEDAVEWVSLPGAMGEMTILNNHIPLVTYLRKGEIVIKKDQTKKVIPVEKGIVAVAQGGQVKVLLG